LVVCDDKRMLQQR